MGGVVGALSSLSTVLLGGGIPVASSTLVGLLAAVLVEAGSSSALLGTAAAAGCSAVGGAASSAPQAGSATPWPATWSGFTSDAALKNKVAFLAKIKIKKLAKVRKLNTYRSDRRWVTVNLLLALPVGA